VVCACVRCVRVCVRALRVCVRALRACVRAHGVIRRMPTRVPHRAGGTEVPAEGQAPGRGVRGRGAHELIRSGRQQALRNELKQPGDETGRAHQPITYTQCEWVVHRAASCRVLPGMRFRVLQKFGSGARGVVYGAVR
jgi:hypothetical protein